MIEILGFAGSLRSGSYNRALLEAAADHAPDGARVEVHPLDGIPLYDEDLDTDERRPETVREFREAIAATDALLVATPEYNRGMAGVTKNAIDWASRPARRSVLRGKPAGVVGVTPGPWGTVRAQEQLRLALSAPLARVLPLPGLTVRGARDKFDGEGRLADEETLERLADYLDALVAWTEEVGGGG